MPAREFEMGPATRDAYGDALAELGAENPRIVALDADLSKSTKSGVFGKKFPDRYWNIGIQEMNLVGMACGLASTGRIPFISSFAVFIMAKGFDQLRMNVAYANENVKVVGSHGGVSIGEDGPSQMGIEDVALACLMPGFTVCVPADAVAAKAMTRLAAEHVGPVYLRTGRPKVPLVYRDGERFTFGEAKKHGSGGDVCIVANGLLVAESIRAADLLRDEGIEATVLDMHTVKPLDEKTLLRAAKECGAVVTAEEHLVQGALGAAVAQCLSRSCPVPMEFVGVQDTYAESGTPQQLLDKYGLNARTIADAARKAAARKSSSGAEAAHHR
jgi:transketolase